MTMTMMNTPINLTLKHNAAGQLQLIDSNGKVFEDVYVVRAFPISAPEQGLSIINQEGQELAWIASLEDVPAQMRALIEAELAQREFMPLIERIYQVSSFATPSVWDVLTNKGPTKLTLKAEDHIWRLKNNQILIADKNGVNFMINDIGHLDKQSKKLLDRFL